MPDLLSSISSIAGWFISDEIVERGVWLLGALVVAGLIVAVLKAAER